MTFEKHSSRKWPPTIPKRCLYNFDPHKPHFYMVKLGFTGVYLIFLISSQNIDCGYSLEPPRRGGSNEYPQSMFWAETWKISKNFIWFFSFFVVKFSIYLNRHVFVMKTHFRIMQIAFWLGFARAQSSKANFSSFRVYTNLSDFQKCTTCALARMHTLVMSPKLVHKWDI